MVRPRFSWRTVAWIFLLALAVIWGYKYTRLIQGFETVDEEKAVQDELTTAMTAVSEILCPMQKEVFKKLMEDEVSEDENENGGFDKLSEERKKVIILKATQKFLLMAQGSIFPCPPPSNPDEIPVNIKDYMLATCRGSILTIVKIKDDVAKARECHKEPFTVILPTIPVYINHTTKEAYEDIAKIEEEIMRKNRIVALQAKLRGIKEAMMDPLFIRTTTDYKEVKRLKEEAESGSMTSNCST